MGSKKIKKSYRPKVPVLELEIKWTTEKEMLKQIKLESHMLDLYRQKIEQEIVEEKLKEINMGLLKSLYDRIYQMYEVLLNRFTVDNESLTGFTTFCLNNNSIFNKGSSYVKKVMENIQKDPEMYITAATFEYESSMNVKLARKYFAEGIKYHRKFKWLYLEELKMEVQYLNMQCTNTSTRTCFLTTAVMQKFEYISRNFMGDLNFNLILVDVALEYRVIELLQNNNVFRNMISNFSDCPELWRKMAKLSLHGLHYNQDLNTLTYETNSLKNISRCFKTYEAALELPNMDITFVNDIWQALIEHAISVRNTSHVLNEVAKVCVNRSVERLFEKAHECKQLLDIEKYYYWANFTEHGKMYVYQKAIEVIKDNLDIWKRIMLHLLLKNDVESIKTYFQKCVQEPKIEPMPLWTAMTRQIIERNDPILVEKFYRIGIALSNTDISVNARIEYFDWCFKNKDELGIVEAFNELKDLTPPCKYLYRKMFTIKISPSVDTEKVKTMRLWFKEACDKFGTTEIDIWVDFIKFEYKCYRIVETETTPNVIYDLSLLILNDEYRSGMEETFTQLKKKYGDAPVKK